MKFGQLLSPIKIGNVVLKNRMMASNALPHFTQGPEKYPNDAIIEYLAGIAKNGASVVTFADWSDTGLRSFGNGDICHFPVYDLTDPATENCMNQLTDAIHFYGSKASIALAIKAPKGYDVYAHTDTVLPDMFVDMMDDAEDIPPKMAKLMQSGNGQKLMFKLLSYAPSGKNAPPLPFSVGPQKELTENQMDEIIMETLEKLRYYRACGFDMCTLHMAYRSTLLANFLSPLMNKRTDKYGGSMENRARFPLMLCQAIKDEFGQDFLIEAQVSGEDGKPGGFTVEDLVAFSKLAEGKIDILQIRAGDADDAHPTGYNSACHEPLTLKYAAAVKSGGAKIMAEPIGGFQNPADMERFLAEGKADLFGMARAFICDFDFYRKILDERAEDIVPCIRCNRCHGLHKNGPWLTVCSVNPRMGIEHRLEKLISMPNRKKRIAVIGGGPAGMTAAITAYDRGHEVILYEKSDSLGGQLKHTDYVSFKWPLKQFKDYLIEQVQKRKIEVRMQTSPTADEIKVDDFDAVLISSGAVPSIPSINGARTVDGVLSQGLWNPIEIYGREQELGERIIIVGGSDIGMETGMYLADCGHKVTVLTRQGKPASASDRVHYYSMMKRYWKQLSGFSVLVHATTTEVTPKCIRYTDKSGDSRTLHCDNVIVCGGMKPLMDEALKYSGCAPEFRIIGDCESVGNVQSAVRSGFAAASSL